MIGKIFSLVSGAVVMGGLGVAELVLHPENKELKKENSELRANAEALNKIIFTYKKPDTVAIWIHGYSQAIDDKACIYFFSNKDLTATMGNGKCQYLITREVSTLNNKIEQIKGEGEIQDASIHVK